MAPSLLLRDQGAATGAHRGDVTQWRLYEPHVLLHDEIETVGREQFGDSVQVLGHVHFHNYATHLLPVFVSESAQHVQLALLDVDLQQVYALDAKFGDDAGERSQTRRKGLGREALIEYVVSFLLDPFEVARVLLLLVDDVRLDHTALRLGIGVGARQEGKAREEGERLFLVRVRETEVEQFDIRAVEADVRAE